MTLYAKVSTASGTPSGTVTFYNGTQDLGSATLNTSGAATLTTFTLPVGTDSLTATYGGSSVDAASTSTAVSETIDYSIGLTAGPNPDNSPIVALTVTATVLGISPTHTPAGCTFYENGQQVGLPASLNASGAASVLVPTSDLVTGSIADFTASCGGTTSAVLQVPIGSVLIPPTTGSATTTTLTVTPNPATVGQPVTLAATVLTSGGGFGGGLQLPVLGGGTVTFYNDNQVLGYGIVGSNG